MHHCTLVPLGGGFISNTEWCHLPDPSMAGPLLSTIRCLELFSLVPFCMESNRAFLPLASCLFSLGGVVFAWDKVGGGGGPGGGGPGGGGGGMVLPHWINPIPGSKIKNAR